MMTYTEDGIGLINDAVASGTKVNISKVRLIADPERSDGPLTYDITSMAVEKKDDRTLVIKIAIDNHDFAGDYYFGEIYVYAVDRDGTELLFCFERTGTCPVYIPQFDGRPVKSEIDIYLTVANADAIEIQDGIYVLQADFEERMKNTCNIQVIQKDEEVIRSKNTWYLRVTGSQMVTEANNLKVSPLMGIRIV